MTSSPLVSVIIPFYNRPNETLKAISSALNQTYSPIEIIVVDDGSEDTIENHSYVKEQKVTLITHTKNLGANAARNTGFNNSKGKWISFLDSDDIWDSNKIEILVTALEQKNEYQIAYCSFRNMLKNESIYIFEAKYNGNIYKNLLAENVVGSASVPIISRTILDAVNGFDESLKSAQDWDLWLRVAERGYQFKAIPQALMNYTLPTSEHHISNSEKAFWEGRKAFLKKHKSKYTRSNRKAFSKVYSDMGFLFLNRFENRYKALFCFIKAINSNPKRAKSWRGLAAVFLPKFILLNQTNKKAE